MFWERLGRGIQRKWYVSRKAVCTCLSPATMVTYKLNNFVLYRRRLGLAKAVTFKHKDHSGVTHVNDQERELTTSWLML
jgi:hypothetical protein